jgi:hypothetical protein
MQRLLKESQVLMSEISALDSERARLSAELDRTRDEVSAVLADLAERCPPEEARKSRRTGAFIA